MTQTHLIELIIGCLLVLFAPGNIKKGWNGGYQDAPLFGVGMILLVVGLVLIILAFGAFGH